MIAVHVAPLAPEARSLASFQSDAEARTDAFFDAYAKELPADMAARFTAYGQRFIRRHARVQLRSLFKLERAQCNKVIADVNQEMAFEHNAGEEDAIRESIEEAAGFEFQKPTAPDSAALVASNKRNRSEEDEGEGGEAKQAKGRSLSQIMPRSKQVDAALPDYVFEVITTPDPVNNPISELELSALTDETLKFLSKTYGRHNVGWSLARIYAAQIRKKVKLGDRGKKNRVLGINRDLAGMLVEKARNRTYKAVSARDRTLEHGPCLVLWPWRNTSARHAQENYKSTLTVHPDELSEDVKVVFDSKLGSSCCVTLSEEAIIKREAPMEARRQQESESDEQESIGETGKDETGKDETPPARGFLVFGDPERQPLADCTNSVAPAAPALTAEEQLRVAQERMAKETAVAKAVAKATATAATTAAAAKAAMAAAAAVAAAEGAALAKSVAKADELFEAKVVFAKDVPDPPLPAFDFTGKELIGKLVLIPAKKYPAFATSDAAGRDDFMGWAGKLVGYENNKQKMKVKIRGDTGYEHLTIKGTGAYALHSLVRLI